ncbi:MAG: hypothetical protein HYR91_06960 [Flavobacteriia bacterium]|nr:hypothetical protein [Flavobacteriia bacterium]
MKIFLISLIFSLTGAVAFGSLSIEGSYQRKNLYVQNPMDNDGFGYCATKVTVNGDILPGGTSMGAFEIDFSIFNIEIGEPVFIVIEHNEGCKPKILNPEVLLPRSTFKISSIEVNQSGLLIWKTTEEHGKLPFIIEQFRWNKWVVVGEVHGKGTPSLNTYEFQVSPHSGENMIRVIQIDHSGTKKTSSNVKFVSTLPAVTKSPVKVKNEINFSSNGKPVETRYEIHDAYGSIVKKGVGTSVNCENLVNGLYYISYDNITESFIKS